MPDNIYSVKSAGERIGGCLGMTDTVWPSWTVTARESSGTARTTSSRAAPRQKVSRGIFQNDIMVICVLVPADASGSKDKDNDDKDSDRYLVSSRV